LNRRNFIKSVAIGIGGISVPLMANEYGTPHDWHYYEIDHSNGRVTIGWGPVDRILSRELLKTATKVKYTWPDGEKPYLEADLRDYTYGVTMVSKL